MHAGVLIRVVYGHPQSAVRNRHIRFACLTMPSPADTLMVPQASANPAVGTLLTAMEDADIPPGHPVFSTTFARTGQEHRRCVSPS
jgi:hypothetical protein